MRVFVTVGTLFPFDRLVRAVDDWCADRPHVRATAQIGDATYRPRHMAHVVALDSDAFDRTLSRSDLIIGHAGMGLILKALVQGKPLVVMPRDVALGEVNTDHQFASARVVQRAYGVAVAWDERGLGRLLADPSRIEPPKPIGPFASSELVSGLRAFIEGRRRPWSSVGDAGVSPSPD